jgi:hypothetical protein
VGEEHTHGANVPDVVHVWAPIWPVTQAQAMAAPGTQTPGAALVAVADWPPVPPPPFPARPPLPPVTAEASGEPVALLPPPQPASDATRRHERTTHSLVTM